MSRMGRVVVTYRESESRCEDGLLEHDGSRMGNQDVMRFK